MKQPRKVTITPLSPSERETVMVCSDANDVVHIHTYQSKMITKLKKSGATLVNEGRHGTTKWAEFTIPFNLVSFRSKRAARPDAGKHLKKPVSRMERPL